MCVFIDTRDFEDIKIAKEEQNWVNKCKNLEQVSLLKVGQHTYSGGKGEDEQIRQDDRSVKEGVDFCNDTVADAHHVCLCVRADLYRCVCEWCTSCFMT